MIGTTELFLIIIAVILLFGAKKIPEIARGLGRAEAEYKNAKRAFNEEEKKAVLQENHVADKHNVQPAGAADKAADDLS
ncbi:MAG: twin-arginine translocase TatA/TatE family subunit [Elusimicrobiales bacterium]|nr:twin-arginine translocase TatA/TatE family subunit [Elusimicrobiales bacterium]